MAVKGLGTVALLGAGLLAFYFLVVKNTWGGIIPTTEVDAPNIPGVLPTVPQNAYWSSYMGGYIKAEDFANSWTSESIKTGTVNTALGTLDTLLSGRGWTADGGPITNQVAYYNPETGNAWGGVTSTMDFLYNSDAPEAIAWRARYG